MKQNPKNGSHLGETGYAFLLPGLAAPSFRLLPTWLAAPRRKEVHQSKTVPRGRGRPNPPEVEQSGRAAAKAAHSFLSTGISASNLITLRLEGTDPTSQLHGRKGPASLVPVQDLANRRLHRKPTAGMSWGPRGGSQRTKIPWQCREVWTLWGREATGARGRPSRASMWNEKALGCLGWPCHRSLWPNVQDNGAGNQGIQRCLAKLAQTRRLLCVTI